MRDIPNSAITGGNGNPSVVGGRVGTEFVGAEIVGEDVVGDEAVGAEIVGADVVGADFVGAEVVLAKVAGAEVVGAEVFFLSFFVFLVLFASLFFFAFLVLFACNRLGADLIAFDDFEATSEENSASADACLPNVVFTCNKEAAVVVEEEASSVRRLRW